MNFGKISNRLQKYERAKAKLNEFGVSESDRKVNKLGQTSSNELLFSTIRVLSQYAECYCGNEENQDLYNDLSFVAHFYENYEEGEKPNDYFFLLTGCVANVLSDNFGNAKSLISKIDHEKINSDVACLLLEYIAKALGVNYETNYVKDFLREEYYYKLLNEIENDISPDMLGKLNSFYKELLFKSDAESSFWGLLLYAIHKKFIENSAVRNIPKSSNSTFEDWKKYFTQKRSIKVLWQAQKLLIDKDILKGKSATIQLPTGVGKTKSIELIVASAFLLRDISLAIIVAPLRALCNEIEYDLHRSLKNIVEISSIPDVLEDEEIDYSQKQVVVLTPEKLSYLLHHDSKIVERCGLIIFDEAHMFDDSSRGVSYELLVLKINSIISQVAQKVFISAVMPNAAELNKWLTYDGEVVTDKDIKRTDKSIAFYSRRFNNLYFYQQNDLLDNQNEMVFIPKVCSTNVILETWKIGERKGTAKRVFPNTNNGEEVALYLACKFSAQNGCSAIYINRVNGIHTLAKTIEALNSKGFQLLENIKQNTGFQEVKKIYKLAEEHYGEDYDLVKIMALGFFSHFGTLENGIRLSIEYEVKKHNIACIICTSTLAEGVNLPIRHLYLTSLKNTYGQFLTVRKFQNLIGRAARSGEYTEGSLICTKSEYVDKKDQDDSQWNEIVSLFDQTKSEKCESAILSIFDDLHIPYTSDEFSGISIVNAFIEMYIESGELHLDDIAEIIYKNGVKEFVKRTNKKDKIVEAIKSSLMSRFRQIELIVEKIENFILEEQVIDFDSIAQIAQRTLAYNVEKNDERKAKIIELFLATYQKIVKLSEEKRAVYSKTMSGITTLNLIDDYLSGNKGFFINCEFATEDWIFILANLSKYCVEEKSFFYKLSEDQKIKMINLWVNGDTYKNISLAMHCGIDDVISTCHDVMNYTFNILMSSLIELLPQYKSEKLTEATWNEFVNHLVLFQQKVKYGLPNSAAIAAYEYGYSDRIIALLIGKILTDKYGKKSVEEYKKVIKGASFEIKEILKDYPNYFTEVIQI